MRSKNGRIENMRPLFFYSTNNLYYCIITIIHFLFKGKFMSFQFENSEPVYLQITNHIKSVLASGEIKSGSRIPSVRKLAADFSVNPNTVQKALRELKYEGYLHSARTSGHFVTDDPEKLNELKTKNPEAVIKKFIIDMFGLGYDRDNIIESLKKFL